MCVCSVRVENRKEMEMRQVKFTRYFGLIVCGTVQPRYSTPNYHQKEKDDEYNVVDECELVFMGEKSRFGKPKSYCFCNYLIN